MTLGISRRAQRDHAARTIQAAFRKWKPREYGGPSCPICLDPFEQSPLRERVTTVCKHVFHQDCLNRWKNTDAPQGNTCPLCRLAYPLEQPIGTLKVSLLNMLPLAILTALYPEEALSVLISVVTGIGLVVILCAPALGLVSSDL